MNFNGLDLAIWIAWPVGELLLLFVLFVRHRAASFPIFTVSVAIDAAISIVLIYAENHCSRLTYRTLLAALDTLNQFIELLVVYEISIHVFRPTGVWARDVRKTLVCIAGGGIALALSFALLVKPAFSHPIIVWTRRIDLFYSVLMSELFVGMLILSSTAGLPWKTHTARIAQGFGASSLYYLLRDLICGSLDRPWERRIFPALDRIGSCICIACEVYWIVTLWRDAPAPQELPERLRNQIYTLQRHVENDLIKIRSWRSS